MLLSVILLLFTLTSAVSQSEIQDIRLVNGTYGSHMGRIEVLYNDTWGTICNNLWNYQDARIACRSLGFITSVCAVTTPSFPPASEDVPVWISDVQCTGREQSFSDCPFSGFGVDMCPQVGGETICASREIVGKTTNLRQVGGTDHTVDLTWNLPSIPEGVSEIRWRIEGFGAAKFARTSDIANLTSFSFTAMELDSNSSYRVRVRTDIRYPFCRGYLWGNFSAWVSVQTTEEVVRVSNISLRLVPPFPGVNFFGRVEVLYNGSWGTVCDDYIRLPEANVICRALNFERALCFLPSARYGPGSGPIWIDNFDCGPTDKIVEDCSFNDWGVHNCRHAHDVSVICRPNDTVRIDNLRVERAVLNNIELSWNAFAFPPGTTRSQYLIRIRSLTFPSSSERIQNVPSSETRAIVTRLPINRTFEFTVEFRYSLRYCGASISGGQSLPVQASIVEAVPTGPPRSVHLVVLNSTAVEVQWNYPYWNQRNGIIRGFKVFVQKQGNNTERVINVAQRNANELIVGELLPATFYTFSVLAYTVGDGPRSIHLTASTFSNDYVELIIDFGILGNGLDRAVRPFGRLGNIEVYCGSGTSGVQLSWFHENLTEVSYIDSRLRQGKNSEGTSILQIAHDSHIDFCDAGVYACRAELATNASQITESRNFSLLVGNAPPSPDSPVFIAVGSTWVTLGWSELSCDGGHPIGGVTIRYKKETNDILVSSYRYLYNLEPTLQNYTIYNLEPETPYTFAVQLVSAEFLPSPFSDENTVSTLLPAPSPPRDVRARLVKSPVVEVTWREPASPHGIIVFYTVYATVADEVLDIPFRAIKNVPGHIGATNVTVTGTHSDVVFQVSATVRVNGIENEGERSEATESSTVFVPNPNLPVPNNFEVINFTNTSVSVAWVYPIQRFSVPIQKFQVSYRAHVSWYSPDQSLVQFTEFKKTNVSSEVTAITFSQLLPDTEYHFKVSALTEYGRGAEVATMQSTTQAYDGKLAYFQLKMNSVGNCFQWQLNSAAIVSQIRDSINSTLNNLLCSSCEISSIIIQNDTLYCDRSAVDQAVYRGRIRGTASISCGHLLAFLNIWVLSASPNITVGTETFRVDSSCPPAMDSPSAPDCFAILLPSTPPPSTMLPTDSRTATTSPVTKIITTSAAFTEQQRLESIDDADLAGIIIGVIIIVLLLLFVILLTLLLVRSFCWPTQTIRMKKLKEEVLNENTFDHDNPFYGGDPKEKKQTTT